MNRDDLGLLIMCGVVGILFLYSVLLRDRVSASVNNNIVIALAAAGCAALLMARYWLAAVIMGASAVWALRVDLKRRRRQERKDALYNEKETEE